MNYSDLSKHVTNGLIDGLKNKKNENVTNAISEYAEITAKQYTRVMEYRKNFMISCAQTAVKELADMISYLQEQDLDYRMFELAKIFGEIGEVAQYGKESMLQGAQAQSFESMFKERNAKNEEEY